MATLMMRNQLPPVTRSAQGTILSYLRLTIEPESVGRARRFISLIMEAWSIPGVDDARVIISEVVTNVVKHVGEPDGTMNITVKRHENLLRIEVHDPSAEMPTRREAGECGESGHGLFLIDELSACWGFSPYMSGKTVWFEIPL